MAAYRIRSPQVVHESVAGEVVAIDFATGSYFSLRGPAESVWSALSCDEARAVDTLAPAAGGAADADQLTVFLDQLVEVGLLERTGEPVAGIPGPDTDTGGLAFEHFTDMEELILLDPVHDVTDAGWPNASS